MLYYFSNNYYKKGWKAINSKKRAFDKNRRVTKIRSCFIKAAHQFLHFIALCVQSCILNRHSLCRNQ